MKEKLKEFYKKNTFEVCFGSAIAIMVIFLGVWCYGLFSQSAENERNVAALALRCGNDHYAGVTKVADGLWRIHCMTKDGEDRFIFLEAP